MEWSCSRRGRASRSIELYGGKRAFKGDHDDDEKKVIVIMKLAVEERSNGPVTLSSS